MTVRSLRIGVLVGLVSFSAALAAAQPSYAPHNDEPNPYQPGVSWGRLPDGRRWGATGGVDIAPDGTIWAYDRCGGNQNGCANSPLTAILHFDTAGTLLNHFGAGLFNFPHGLYVDKDGNVWVTDHGMTPANGKGQTVTKFSPDGKILLTLGKRGVAGDPPECFNQPSDVVVAPNGDIFVADGHVPGLVARIVKFDKTGRFIKTWGSRGPGEHELNGPHALAMDSRGRLFVGDRTNNRVQVFDQDGQLLASWKQFGRPSGIFIDRDDVMYVTDSESREDNGPNGYGFNPGVRRGIRIGSVTDGKVTAFIPDPTPLGASSSSEGVAVDRTGAVYGAEVGPRDMKKYVKSPPSTTSIAASSGAITVRPQMHASLQIEYAGTVIQIDPAMGDIAGAKPADLILVTDIHEDHLNASRIAKLRKSGAPVVVPAAVQKEAGDALPAPLEVLANGQSKSVAGVRVEAVAMYNVKNEFAPGQPYHTKGRGNGYVVTVGGRRLFFAGDTECVPEIRALRDIDVAFLPMNLPFTMPPSEAAECAKAFKPKIAIPYHYQGQRPADFEAALNGTGIDVRLLNWYPVAYRPDVVASARPGALVDIGGRRMHLNCTGRGQPTVVLEGGATTFALDWQLVQPEIAKSTRVCSYDRAGSGWSDTAGRSETPDTIVADLHAALRAAGEAPPFVLVGASVGGLFVRAYQLQYPDDVGGLVFVDSAHEDAPYFPGPSGPVPMWSVSVEQLRETLGRMMPRDAPPPPPMPPTLQSEGPPYDTLPPAVVQTRTTFETRRFRWQSAANVDELAKMFESQRATIVKLHEATIARPQPLGDRPLVVLTPQTSAEPENRALQSKLVALSTNAVQRTIAHSGSEIHLYDPAAVVRAVQDVATAIRAGTHVP